jgi:ubiquinone/menaquinone biosynthesis C-methylase UbiE
MIDRKKHYCELYEQLPRCGPGDDKSTAKAYRWMRDVPAEPYILDIGCGPGMQTLELARLSGGRIIALDNHQQFLNTLVANARKENLSGRIETMNANMEIASFEPGSFDIIWSEGALYIMGFKRGLGKFIRYLKPGGYMAMTEAVWLTDDRPEKAVEFWSSEYPLMKDIDANLQIIQDAGFSLETHFTLPVWSWLTDFYNPMEVAIGQFKQKYIDDEEIHDLYVAIEEEIHIFKKFCYVFGYEFFVMRKPNTQ